MMRNLKEKYLQYSSLKNLNTIVHAERPITIELKLKTKNEKATSALQRKKDMREKALQSTIITFMETK
jgi:hypothetical protein